jgi:hypothetical protein
MYTFGEKCVMATFSYLEEFERINGTVNVVIAAFITAGARIALYGILDKLQTDAIYYDTDSCYQLKGPDSPDLPLEDKLGGLSNELKQYGEGAYISEICCAGAKNYAYKVVDANGVEIITVCKVKGLTLNYRTSQNVNFEVVKKMILEGENSGEVEVQIPNKIMRNMHCQIITKPTRKIYRVCYDKRKRVEGSHITYPYGYKMN